MAPRAAFGPRHVFGPASAADVQFLDWLLTWAWDSERTAPPPMPLKIRAESTRWRCESTASEQRTSTTRPNGPAAPDRAARPAGQIPYGRNGCVSRTLSCAWLPRSLPRSQVGWGDIRRPEHVQRAIPFALRGRRGVTTHAPRAIAGSSHTRPAGNKHDHLLNVAEQQEPAPTPSLGTWPQGIRAKGSRHGRPYSDAPEVSTSGSDRRLRLRSDPIAAV